MIKNSKFIQVQQDGKQPPQWYCNQDNWIQVKPIKQHFNTDKSKMAYPRKMKVSSKLGLNIIGKHMILLNDSVYSWSMNQDLATSRSGCTWITRLLINHIRKPIHTMDQVQSSVPNLIYFSYLMVGSLDEISKSDITKATVLQEQSVISNRQQTNQNTSVQWNILNQYWTAIFA